MKVQSNVQVNDMRFPNLLAVVLTLQVALWAVMGLDALGWQVTVVQQLIGVVYLTFVPGILILSTLRIYHLCFAEIALYTVGLSVTVMFSIGFVVSVVCNALNIIKPFSFLTITSSVSFVVLLLCAIAYLRNRTHPEPLFNTKMSVPLAPTLFLCIIPFITVFSTYLVNTYNVSAGQLVLYLLLGVVVLLVAFDKFIPSQLYSLTVFVIAVSLLFQQTLISSWLTGWDIQSEWNVANAVLTTGVWNPNVYGHYQALLSIVVLAPIYSLISSLSLVWVFKLVYPVIFALVPVGLYQVFRRQLNNKVAFLSCFFFVSLTAFYLDLTSLARQEVAELFFVLLILLLVSNEMNKRIQSALFLAFGLSLVVSHPGLTYILVLFLFVMWLVSSARVEGWKLTPRYLRTRVGTHKGERNIAPSPKLPPRSAVTIVFILLLLIASNAWYAYTSQASVVQAVLTIGGRVSGSIADLFNPAFSQALTAATKNVAPGTTIATAILHRVNASILYLNQFLILAGVCLVIFLKKKRFKLQFSYVVLSITALGFLIVSVAVPYLGAALDATRVYQIVLIFLAPFLAIGFIEIGEIAGVTMSKVKSKLGFSNSMLVNPSRLTRLLAIYLVLFMLFQTSFIFTLAEGQQSMALNNQLDVAQFNPREIIGATWLVNNGGGQGIHADVFKTLLFYALAEPSRVDLLDYPNNTSASGFYVFFGTHNIEYNQAMSVNNVGVNAQYYYTNATYFISNRSLIYSNGGANVYW
jgi:uncharacterized membrane protein